MDRRTIDFYTKNAERLSARYLQADMSPLYRDIIPELPPGGSVLEIGCGNGRDARNLAAQGFRVTATDASEGMLEEATRLTRGNNPLFLLRAFPLKPSELHYSSHGVSGSVPGSCQCRDRKSSHCRSGRRRLSRSWRKVFFY